MLGNHALVDVELRPVCEISNCVDDHVKTRRISALGPAIQIVDRIHEQTAIVRRVGEWLEHRRRVRTERAVDKSLQCAPAKPGVAAIVFGNVIAETLPTVDWNGG